MDEIIRLANTLVIVDEGHVPAIGPVEELTSRLDLRPLTGRYEAGSAFAARIVAHDEAYALTTLEFPGGSLRVPRVDAPTGTGPMSISVSTSVSPSGSESPDGRWRTCRWRQASRFIRRSRAHRLTGRRWAGKKNR